MIPQQLVNRTVYLTTVGSRLYGFATDQSDWDYKGIVIPELSSIIGLNSKFESTQDKNLANYFGLNIPCDITLFSLQKFALLAMEGNPSCLEILFAPKEFWQIEPHIVFQSILEQKNLFLSKRILKRFCGYAYSQLSKIKEHLNWQNNPLNKKPERLDFGLPETRLGSDEFFEPELALFKQRVTDFVSENYPEFVEDVKTDLVSVVFQLLKKSWTALHPEESWPIGRSKEIVDLDCLLMTESAREISLPDSLIEILKKERQFRTAKQKWESYSMWLKHGKDSKAEFKDASHMVRLLRMAEEILTTGSVLVQRPDAQELLSIRNGAWSIEKIIEFQSGMENRLENLAEKSLLPTRPNLQLISSLIEKAILDYEFNS